MLTFLEHDRFVRQLSANTCVSAVITTPDLAPRIPAGMGIALSSHPRRDFVHLHNALVEQTDFYGARHPSEIDPSARIHPSAVVSPETVYIGSNVIVEANAVIGAGCTLHKAVVIRSGAVLGAAGFQTCRGEDGYLEMAHAGTLVLDAGVQVHSNATIARGLSRQATRIGTETRIGNNAFISHNVDIGARCFIGHGAVVNGNTRIGRQAWVGPGAVLANGLSVGDASQISLGSVVIRDVGPGEHVSGNFAVPHNRLLRRMSEAS